MPRALTGKLKTDRQLKMKQMVSSGLSLAEVGRRLDISREYVRQVAGNFEPVERICIYCLRPFIAKRAKTKYCGIACRQGWCYHGHARREPDPVRHFAGKIAAKNNGDCWNWQGYCNSQTGYGRTSWQGKDVKTHRLMWRLVIGPIPDKLHVLHNVIIANV